jgi:hypothetical protein
LDVLRDDEERMFCRAPHVINRNDMRVFETGNRTGFAQIGFGVFGASHPISVRHFDGYSAIQLLVTCQINDSEASRA